MKKLWSKIRSKKHTWIFLGIILTFGILIGIYFGVQSQRSMENTLTNYALTLKESAIHFAIPHFTVLSLLLILTFIEIGIPLSIGYLFYEGLTIGFCSTLFTLSFQGKGLAFIILFFSLTKLPFLIIFGLFFHKMLLIGKSIISWLIYKNNKKDYILHLAAGCFLLDRKSVV